MRMLTQPLFKTLDMQPLEHKKREFIDISEESG